MALLVLMLAVVPVGSAAAVVPDAGVRVREADAPQEIDAAKAAGVPWVSLSAGWPGLQPSAGASLGPHGPGAEAWNKLEADVRYAHSLGLRTLVQFTGAPAWATGESRFNAPPTPAGRAAYAAFFRELSSRLGPYIDAYSPWNEVNQPEYWNPPDPAAFAALQRAVYPAIKEGDPSGIVVSGTIYSKGGTFDFLRAAYAAGLRGSFDVLGWMLFSTGQPEDPPPAGRGAPQPTLPSVLALQAVLDQVDPGRPIWIVEYGYSTCQVADHGFVCVSEATQADYLTRAFTYMRRYLDVERLFWFSMRNRNVGPTREANYGLLRFDFSAKPSLAALRALQAPASDGAAGSPAVAQLPRLAARPPNPSTFRARNGVRVSLGRPVLRLRRGRFSLTLTVRMAGGRTRLLVQGFRGGRWRDIVRTSLVRSSRVTLRFPDRGYLGIRIRGSRPGSSRWVVSRVVRVPPRVIARRGVPS
jgi:hypothetical protein